VRGVMSEVDQTIQRLDIPAMSALPIAFDPPFETTPPQQAPRWTARAAVVTALAAIAVILLGWQAAGRMLRFEVDRAVLSIPSQPLLAGAEGYVVWNGVRSGQTVATGDTIARIADIGLEREIALAELAVREREAQLALFRQRSSADDRRGAVVKVPASLRSFHPTAAGTSPGEVEILLEFARERHAALVAQRERLVVRAPGDGVLLDLAAAHQVSVRKGDPVAVIAPPQADPTITVWLTPAETLSVAVGDRAVLWLPRTRTSATARVVSMQWGSGLGSGEISPTGTGAHEAGSEHRWTKVVLRLEEPRSVPALEQAATGLPVVVSFERAWAVNAVASLRQTAAQAASVVRDGLKRAFSQPHAAASLSHE
jgi:pyruvate/2-oxoglutarate dehydrogenase complex dihydrolipoamide acyltransferase (E2) component